MNLLYQKYRPKDFDQIFSHKKIITELKQRSVKDAFAQVHFLTGVTGVGKSSLQRIIAKHIACLKKQDGIICNECSVCKSVDNEDFTKGVLEFNASNLGIDEMRAIEDLALSKSFFSARKVIIIDELQELHASKKAQKNLLKILEKINKSTYFLLGSMEDEKVDASIKGRTVKYVLKTPTTEEIARYLNYVCEQEGIPITEHEAGILFILAEGSGGSFRQAVEFLDRVIHGNLWTEDDVREEIGLYTEDDLVKVLQALYEGSSQIFQVKWTEDLVGKVRKALITCYKTAIGAPLEFYEKNLIRVGDEQRVLFILDTLFHIFEYAYFSQEILNYHLIQCLKKNYTQGRKKRGE